MIRNLINRVRLAFWRTLHLIVNFLAWRFAHEQVIDDELRGASRLWRLNDYVASKYIPPFTKEDARQIMEGIASEMGLTVVFDENGDFAGFADVTEGQAEQLGVPSDRIPTIPDVEDETTPRVQLPPTGTDRTSN